MNKRVRRLVVGVAAALLLAAAGCGRPDRPDTGASTGPEKASLTVGVLPTWDAASLYLGIEKGFFRAEGLTVSPVILANADEAASRNMSGAVDITYTGYVPSIIAAAKGLKLRIIVDGSLAKPNMYVIVTPERSPIRSPKDLTGKTIGMINSKGLPAILTSAALAAAGVDPKAEKFVDVTYPAMGVALQRGSVDASFATDPYLAQFQQTLGARTVLDTIGGPTDNFPIGCYQTSERFAEQNPRTVAAFQRAMAKAQTLASGDRDEVVRLLPTFIKGLTAQTAQTIRIGTFSTGLDQTRAQRVADFMTQQHVLSGHFDVSSIVR